MSSLDPELKLKLARAARDLAAELEAGTGPELGFGQLFFPSGQPCCVMGHVYARAGVETLKVPWSDMPDVVLDPEVRTMSYPVENANDALAPWLKDITESSRTPLPNALRDYAFAVEGL